jgi:hypothetical protein
MDDIWLIWVKKKVQFSDFISHISHCTKLNWTLEINQNNSIFFLNLYIWKGNLELFIQLMKRNSTYIFINRAPLPSPSTVKKILIRL